MNTCRAPIAYVALLVIFFPLITNAETADEIQQQINVHNAAIEQLNKDIALYQSQLDTVSSKKQTLQNTLDQISLSLKQTSASIHITEQKIRSTQLQIQQLQTGIVNKQTSIAVGASGLAESMRRINEYDAQPLILSLMADSKDTAAMWGELDRAASLQSAISDRMTQLSREKRSLDDTKKSTEAKRAELLTQQSTLLAQQGSLKATKKAQDDLLAATKSQESTYQKILAQKKAQESDFEQALGDLQTKLKYAVDPSQVPVGGSGVLHWPLDTVRITQYFGNTAFALSGAYNGKGHNGMDFAASIGTPIHAALGGVVLGTGNTDAVRGCYSFGRWVLMKHDNGLDTMYAHLSQINVSEGQTVHTGDVLGFSGATGYATGPHLHFGVYLAAATQIIKLGSATNKSTPCANATMPVAPLAGYLNPIMYLPK